MNRKYILREGLKQAVIYRMLAKMIDLFIALILSMFFFPIGILLSIFYLAICDSLQMGQSIGKKFMGFFVVSLKDGTPCSHKQSFIRNLPFLIPLIFTLVPLWGWIFSVILIVPLSLLEVYLLLKLDSGHRLGDVMADTTVIANDQHRADLRQNKSSWFDEAKPPVSS